MASGISYYPELIPEFLREHRQLLATYGAILRSAEGRNVVEFKSGLENFKSLLVAHLLKEAVKLYVYMRQMLRDDEVTHALVTSYKKEMDGIGRVAMAFVDGYMAKTPDQIDFTQVVSELHEIGKVLGDRIRREENELYLLYHDAY